MINKTDIQAYSIYKSNTQRYVMHIIAMLLMILYRILFERLSFNGGTLQSFYFTILFQSVRVIILFYLWNTAFYYYKHRIFVLAIFLFLIAMPVDWSISLLMIKISSHYTWAKPFIQRYWDIYIHLHPYSLSYLIFFLSDAFWGTIPFIMVKIIIEIYQNAQTQKQLQERNNELQFEKAQSNIPSEWLKTSLAEIHSDLQDNRPAQKAVDQLSQLLHFAFVDARKKTVLLTDEIQFLNNFLEFERMRHNPEKVSIQLDFQLESNKETKIAPLIFINFIENAFKHGVNSTTNASWVKVSLIQYENDIHFNVKNSLPNKNSEQTKIKDIGGVGLDNVKKRLELEYPNNYQLTFSNDDIFEVDLKINQA
jgi:two-component system, LytTR family, sensor kinase